MSADLNTLTPIQYGRAIKRVGLSQRKAGPFLGFTERQSRRIIAGEAQLPLAAAKLLRLMIQKGFSPEDVDELFSTPLPPQ